MSVTLDTVIQVAGACIAAIVAVLFERWWERRKLARPRGLAGPERVHQPKPTYFLAFLALLLLLAEVVASGLVAIVGFQALLHGPAEHSEEYLVFGEAGEPEKVDEQAVLDAALQKPAFTQTLLLAGDILLVFPAFLIGGFAARRIQGGGFWILLGAVLISKLIVGLINSLDPTIHIITYLPRTFGITLLAAALGYWWARASFGASPSGATGGEKSVHA